MLEKQTLALSLDPCFVPPGAPWWRWRWRRRREAKGSGSLLGVELVLQLHEFSGSFDLVGNLLPLREETLALLKGQALRSATGDRVLLLLTANPGTPCHHLCFSNTRAHSRVSFTNISLVLSRVYCLTVWWGKGELAERRGQRGLTSLSICLAGPCRLLLILQLLPSFQCTS